MTASHLSCEDKHGIARGGGWLCAVRSTASPLQVDSAGCWPQAAGHSLTLDCGVLDLMAVLRGRGLWEMWSSRYWNGRGQPWCTQELGRGLGVGSRGGCWPLAWDRRLLSGFASGDGTLQWRVFLSVFLLERRSARSSAYTYLCKNAKWSIIFFAFSFMLRKELWLFP